MIGKSSGEFWRVANLVARQQIREDVIPNTTGDKAKLQGAYKDGVRTACSARRRRRGERRAKRRGWEASTGGGVYGFLRKAICCINEMRCTRGRK